nr:MAG TPA: hypothetical protein [Caudoviricetes sp.]
MDCRTHHLRSLCSRRFLRYVLNLQNMIFSFYCL